jgi:hypothetical protein
MFESLFGAETPLAVRFFIAFVVVFALIGATAWLVRRFGSAGLGGHTARGRQPRIAVIEAGPVDGRRKLVLVRRDNVEHLIMIGGPTDIVVEQNIVRGQAARDVAPARNLAAEAGTWPAEPAPRLRPSLPEEPSWLPDSEPQVPMPTPVAPPPPMPLRRPARPVAQPSDPLAGLAADMGRSTGEHEPPAVRAPVPRTAPPIEPKRAEPPAPPRRAEPPAAPRAAEPAPAHEPMREKPAAPDPLAAIIASPPPAPSAPPRAPADANLAEMAHRLEAALRRPPRAPGAPAEGKAPPPPATASMPLPKSDTPHPPEPPAKADAVTTPAPATAPEQNPFSSLEEEMANLLGRPPGKG